MSGPSGLAIDIIGADGSVWPLLDRFAPVRLATNYQGLFSARGETQWADRRVGRRRRGRTLSGRTITLKVIVGDVVAPWRRGEDWRTLDSAWWAALGGGDAPFTLRVSTPGLDRLGRPKVRTLQLWDETVDDGMSVDPAQDGRGVYTVTAEAEDALFSGPEVSETFKYVPGDDSDYYGGAAGNGYGPPFYIGGGSPFSQAAISNPGDVPAYAVWTVTAPFGGGSVGLPGRVVPLTFSQVVSQKVVVVTDPRRRSITDGAGANLWPLIQGVDPLFPPIPAELNVPLAVTLDKPEAGSAVKVSLIPQHRRAW